MNSILLKFKNFGLFELLAILSAAYVVFMLAWTFKLINSKKINLKMNNIDLKNRTAIVTGAAQGFGLAISERFINSGAKVIMWDIDGETLKKS